MAVLTTAEPTRALEPTLPLLGMFPTEMHTHVQPKTCIRMFIAALFIIALKWKPPKCPSIPE